MDKSSIIEFSNKVRDKLNAEVISQAAHYGIFPKEIHALEEHVDSVIINGKVFNSKIKKQCSQLVKQIKDKGYEQVIDEVTYTWFNRLVALKFMEMNGCLPDQIKVFTSTDPNKLEPDILTNPLNLDFLNLDRNLVLDLKAENKDEDLYKYLILKLCNYLRKIMPFLFEKIEDCTELLLPDKLLHTGSVLHDLNSIIPDEDWHEVEIIGWIYQDYIAPKKDEVFADLKKNIKISKENIPAATQLFTPKWIVKYLVENSLGRLWLESNPNPILHTKLKYLIEQDAPAPKSPIYDPEEIKVLDLAMGSGHILVYAFEVLYDIYRSVGYLDSEITPLILNKNLYGLEIDDRAAQLAGFALMMKAKEYDKDLFLKDIELNLYSIQETNNIGYFDKQKYPEMSKVFDTLIDAKNYGSMLRISDIDFFKVKEEFIKYSKDPAIESFFNTETPAQIIKQVEIMTRKYDCVITNPPYMGSKGMNPELRDFVNNEYPNSKNDLMTCFMERGIIFLNENGFLSMINIPSWMFLSSFEKLRITILKNNTFCSLLHLGRGIFGSDFGTVAFVIKKKNIKDFNGVYRKLFKKHGAVDNISQKEKWFLDKNFGFFVYNQVDFSRIPGSPIAYWVSDQLRNIFENKSFYEYTISDGQNKTGDNDKYLRNIWEICEEKIIQKDHESYRWIFYAKGGVFRRWYGNIEYLIDWSKEARIHYRKDKIARLIPEYLWFRKGISWNLISSGSNTGFRLLLDNSTFDVAGSSIFLKDDQLEDYRFFVGFLNTKVVNSLFKIFNPTISLQVKDIRSLPIIFPKFIETKSKIDCLVQECIDISREEWDSHETSWDFKTNELLRHKNTPRLEDAYDNYHAYWKEKFFKLHTTEEELNQIFIDIYDLVDEMTPDVSLEEITILKEEAEVKNLKLVFKKEVILKQFISFAVGCMFGRYSPEKEGLILANKGEKLANFKEKVHGASFLPDEDNIIPILDDEYYTDDIVNRFKEFLKFTFGAETLSENLDFIVGVLSKKGETSEKVIRNYFLKDFYSDHVKMYKKRPIYWLFTSSEKGKVFNELVYMHRYDKTTLAKMRIDYLLDFESKLDSQRSRLEKEISGSKENRGKAEVELAKLNKKIDELVKYDELLQHKADQMIEIDLDDGVVENYKKFEGLVGKI